MPTKVHQPKTKEEPKPEELEKKVEEPAQPVKEPELTLKIEDQAETPVESKAEEPAQTEYVVEPEGDPQI